MAKPDDEGLLGRTLSRHSALTAAVQRLQEEVAKERERRDWVKRSCCVGLQAARAQILRMRAELQAARAAQSRSPSGQEGDADGEAASADETRRVPDLVETDRRKADERNLRLEARMLRQELAKCKHREQNLEAGRTVQETRLQDLAPRLARAKDTLGLARSAALHHKVAAEGSPVSSLDAEADRAARAKAEDKSEVLAQKVQKLQRVYAAQQMLIQRLMEDFTKEQIFVEQKEMQLEAELRRRHHLKGVMRQCSDDMIAAAMGLTAKINSGQTALRRRADAPPGSLSAESSLAGDRRTLSESASAPLPVVAQLPPIESKRGAVVV